MSRFTICMLLLGVVAFVLQSNQAFGQDEESEDEDVGDGKFLQ